MSELTFLCPPEMAGHIPFPQPAAKFVPDWYRTLPREMGMPDAQGLPGLTVRACLPVADAFALGWIIPLPFDIAMSRDPQGQLMFHWAEGLPFQPIELHHPGQIGADKPPFQDRLPLKFINPWRVKMSPGWSAAFVHPINHFELPFTAFCGAVDCDALEVAVNVPFLWNSTAESYVLPAGSPMVQVVPYQRAAIPREADIRGETSDEVATRIAASERKHGEESVYAREWRRKHEKEGT